MNENRRHKLLSACGMSAKMAANRNWTHVRIFQRRALESKLGHFLNTGWI